MSEEINKDIPANEDAHEPLIPIADKKSRFGGFRSRLDSFGKQKNNLFSVKGLDPNHHVHNKQKIIAFGVVVIAVIVAIVVTSKRKAEEQAQAEMIAQTQEAQSKSAIIKSFSAPVSKTSEREVWMATGSAQIQRLTEELKTTQQKNKELESKVENTIDKRVVEKMIQDALRNQPQQKPVIVNGPEKEAEKPVEPVGSIEPPVLVQKPAPISQGGTVITNRFFSQGGVSPSPTGTAQGYSMPANMAANAPVIRHGVKSVSLVDSEQETAASQASAAATVAAQGKAKKVKRVGEYLPAGTFFKAVLIGGIDAPTGTLANSAPLPIIMRVTDLGNLPNKVKFDVRECHVISAAYGDLSLERAMARLETLSCVDDQDIIHEMRIKGTLFGEDGKSGIRGRLVTKQGSVLANALFAGVGSGFGRSFAQQTMQYNQTAFGTTTSIDPSRAAQNGIGMGVGQAMDRLAQYYIKLAEKMYPVIEVDAGRTVDVVLTAGSSYADSDEDTPPAAASAMQQVGNSVLGALPGQQQMQQAQQMQQMAAQAAMQQISGQMNRNGYPLDSNADPLGYQ
ncbi:MAG: hypothetical protein K0U21_00330 [Proteobacteria bacterium]|nr:hypothetical protein [Pseudomonadota bacterium]